MGAGRGWGPGPGPGVCNLPALGKRSLGVERERAPPARIPEQKEAESSPPSLTLAHDQVTLSLAPPPPVELDTKTGQVFKMFFAGTS